MLDYIQDSSDGFRILVRNSPVASATGTFSSLLNDIASQVEHILGREFALRGYDTTLAGLFSQSLAGMVALTGQWWLEVRSPGEDEVAAHLVNLAWTASAFSCTNLRCGSAPSRRTPFVVLFLGTVFHPVAGSVKPQSCTHSDITAGTASRTVGQLVCRCAERGRGSCNAWPSVAI